MSVILEDLPNDAPPNRYPGRLFRLSLDQYHAIAQAGILSQARVELLDGLLVERMTQPQKM